MSLIFNGTTQYGTINNAAMTLSNGAIGFWYTFQSKGSELHYLLSTGALSTTNLNMFYTESGANAGTMSFNRNGTYPNRLSMPADFQNGSTEYLILLEKYAANIYLWYCKAGGTAVRQYIGALVGGNADLGSGQTYYVMTRGDLAADRNAKGKINKFFKMGTDPINGLVSSVVENLANGLLTPLTVSDPHIVFLLDEGVGNSATDEIAGATLTTVNSPTWDVGAPIVTPIAFSGPIVNRTFNVGDSIDLDFASNFTGTQTPFTVSSIGEAFSGVGASLNPDFTVTGIATEGVVAVQIRGTDSSTNTADSNVFSITVNAVAQVPQGTTTIGTITNTDTTASIPYTYSASDETGFEYRLNGGAAVSASASPIVLTGLPTNTPFTIEVRPVNGTGVGSWSAAANFTTDDSPVLGATFTSEPLYNNTNQLTGLLANTPLDYVALYDTDTGELVLRVTGLSTNASGVFTLTSEALSVGIVYKADWQPTSTGIARMPAKAAV